MVAIVLALGGPVQGAEPDSSTVHKYTADVARLAAEPAPAPGGILMVGSSIFRKWTNCVQALAPLPVRNRAFGGSRTEDQLYFFDKIVPSSQAALVVWYCGSNDLNGKKSPEAILQNTKEWLSRTRTALPQARVLLVSVIRAPQKRTAGLLPKVDEVNQELAKLAGSMVRYVDVNPALETADGAPAAGCYVSDNLHLTAEAYRRMTSILRPMIETEWKAARTSQP